MPACSPASFVSKWGRNDRYFLLSVSVLDHPAIINWWYWWPLGVIPANIERPSAPTPPSTLAATPAAPSAPLAATSAYHPSLSPSPLPPPPAATMCNPSCAVANAAKVAQQIHEDCAFALALTTPLPPSPTKSEEAQSNTLIAPSSPSAGFQLVPCFDLLFLVFLVAPVPYYYMPYPPTGPGTM
ncbi:hypothetical protein B0H16DRAFT_1699960 [Mycena metata]|uniref:Uncharacterized protein n=1 Tax=Mycena metata TaxID=1033252 RepID=A0AAD7HGZ1_9AGAR|nr:hypothetical protein B0H16DRAFT_1699960 [Mycena metata]